MRLRKPKPPWMPSAGDRVMVNGRPGTVIAKTGIGRYAIAYDDGVTVADIPRADLASRIGDRLSAYGPNRIP